jgi:hypothetical protein
LGLFLTQLKKHEAKGNVPGLRSGDKSGDGGKDAHALTKGKLTVFFCISNYKQFIPVCQHLRFRRSPGPPGTAFVPAFFMIIL